MSRATPVAISCLVAAPSLAAKDYCFNSTSPPNPAPSDDPDVLVVVPGFKLPGKGKCRAVEAVIEIQSPCFIRVRYDALARPCGFEFEID